MKKTIKLLLCALILIAITSCSNQNKKMQTMIPKDAIAVINLKPGSIVKNAGIEIDNQGNISLPASLKSSLKPEELKSLDSQAKTIAQIGIDPLSDIFVFANKENLSMPVVAYVPLKDEKKTIKALTQNKDWHLTFKEKDGMNYAIAQENVGIVIKDDIMMITFSHSDKIAETTLLSYAKSLYEPSFDGIMNNEYAEKGLGEEDDINIYMNMRQLGSLASLFGGSNPMLQLYSDVDASTCNISLKDSQIGFKSEVFASDNSDYMKIMKQAFDAKPTTDFLQTIPENANGIFSFNINGANIVKFEQVNAALQQFTQDPELQKLDIPGTIASMNGAVSIGLITDYEKSNFEAIISFPSTKAQQLSNILISLLSMLQGITPTPLNNAAQEVQFQNTGMTQLIGISGNRCYVKLFNGSDIASKNNAASNSEVKKQFDDTNAGGLFNLSLNGMNLHFDSKTGKDLTKSEGHFFITGQDGKKLTILEYVDFFKAFGEKMGNISRM